MKVLWLISVTLPQVGQALGLAGQHGGGWILGQLNELRTQTELTVCTVNPKVSEPTALRLEGVDYRLLPKGTQEEFARLLEEVKPDLVHIWGSEYPPAAALFSQCDPDRVLLSIQGLMGPCADHLLDGVPKAYCSSCFIQRMIDRVVPGGLLDQQLAFFRRQAKTEAAMLASLRHVTGRTLWDRRQLESLSPKARYYSCNETLRPAFYEGQWQGGPDAPVLFLSQGNYPLKGLHRLLQALPAVLKKHPDTKLVIAGWPPLERGALLRPVIDWMFPYQRYTKSLIRRLGLQGAVIYTGPLDEEQIRQQYLNSSLYLLCSSIENSPNSLGEAMLLGLPCVASRVGGVESMLTHGQEGLLYPAEDIRALSDAILQMLDDPDFAQACGQRARSRALATHDPAANGRRMLEIYRDILSSPLQNT